MLLASLSEHAYIVNIIITSASLLEHAYIIIAALNLANVHFSLIVCRRVMNIPRLERKYVI